MLRKKGLTRYNPFKEFPTKYEEGENILTKVRRILDENEPLTDGAPLIFTLDDIVTGKQIGRAHV